MPPNKLDLDATQRFQVIVEIVCGIIHKHRPDIYANMFSAKGVINMPYIYKQLGLERDFEDAEVQGLDLLYEVCVGIYKVGEDNE